MAKLFKKSASKSKPKKVKQKIKVPGLWQIYKLSWVEISSFWKPLIGIIIVYAVLNFIFIAGVALLPSSESLNTQIEDLLGEDAGRFISSITLVGLTLYDVTSPSNTMLQLILFLIASMAFVWALRKLRGLKKFKIRQAYYEGTSNLIAMLLVILMLLLTLVPASIAAAALSFGLPIAGNGLEQALLYAFGLLFISLTIYWLAVWWPAFYIIMLPGTMPVTSMRAAAELTKHNRTKIFLRHILIFLTLIFIFLMIVVPVALIWQRIIPITVYATIFGLFGVMHVMLFTLYRSLVDARQP